MIRWFFAWLIAAAIVAASAIANEYRPAIAVPGHLVLRGATPTVSSCGTGGAVAGTDGAGRITLGTSSNGDCTLTFSVAYATAPVCFVTSPNSGVDLFPTVSTTQLVLNTNDSDATVIGYVCVGY